MKETEKRIGLDGAAAQQLKQAVDSRYSRKSVVGRTVIVKVENDDYSPDPGALIDIKIKLVGDDSLLSVKYGSWHGDAARREYEVHFTRTDLANLLAAFGLLGYTKYIVLVTVRTTWADSRVVITLDEYTQLGSKHSGPGCVVRCRHAGMIMVLASVVVCLLILRCAWPGGAVA